MEVFELLLLCKSISLFISANEVFCSRRTAVRIRYDRGC